MRLSTIITIPFLAYSNDSHFTRGLTGAHKALGQNQTAIRNRVNTAKDPRIKLTLKSTCFILDNPSYAADARDLSAFVRRHRDFAAFFAIVPLCVIGLTLNLLVGCVLGRDRTTNRATRFLLQQLALADCLFYIACPLHELSRSFNDYSRWQRTTLSTVLYTSSSISQTAAMWVVVVATHQRYMIVSRPPHALHCVNISRARTAVVVVWISSIVVNISNVLNNEVGCQLSYSTVLFLILVNFLAVAILASWLPTFLVVFFNIRIIVGIRKSNALHMQQDPSSNSQVINNDHRVTLTLIAIFCLLLVCQLPTVMLLFIFKITELYSFIILSPSSVKNALVVLHICLFTSALLIVIKLFTNYVTLYLNGRRLRSFLIRRFRVVRATSDN